MATKATPSKGQGQKNRKGTSLTVEQIQEDRVTQVFNRLRTNQNLATELH